MDHDDEQQELIEVQSDTDELGIKRDWMPDDEDGCDFIIGKIADLKARRVRITENYNKQVDQIDNHITRLIRYYGNPIRWFCESVLDKIKWKQKNVKFLNGTVQFSDYAPVMSCVELEQRQGIHALARDLAGELSPGVPHPYFEWVPPVDGYWKLNMQKFIGGNIFVKEVEVTDDDGVITPEYRAFLKDHPEVECKHVTVTCKGRVCRIDGIAVPSNDEKLDTKG